MNPETTNKVLGSIYGGIVGDAFGSAYEFKRRDTYTVTKNMERNVFGLAAGSFTDDTSMMLCLLDSLTVKKGFHWKDQMDRYVNWYLHGYLSVNGKCFDIGGTTKRSLGKFMCHYDKYKCLDELPGTLLSNASGVKGTLLSNASGVKGTCALNDTCIGCSGEYDSGNGAIMRLCGIPLFYRNDMKKAMEYSRLSSQVTHASPECLECAELMTEIIIGLLIKTMGKSKSTYSKEIIINTNHYKQEKVISIAKGEYQSKSRDQIKTSGYVIDTLEAAMWAFYKFDTFERGIIELAGMGADTDTVCCVYGCIAGVYYGMDAIPKRWLNDLQGKGIIKGIIEPFMDTLHEFT